jgi:hypothetical protein
LEVFLDRAYPDFLLRAASDDHVIRLSVERAACRSSKPRVSTGNPGERSGEICGVGTRRDELSSSSILSQARLMRQTQGEAISKNTL